MKPLCCCGILAALAVTFASPTHARPLRADTRLLPPEEYDHPYQGLLKLTREDDERVLTWLCDGHIACARARDLCDRMPECPNDLRWRFKCVVVMGSDKINRALGADPVVVYRHEVGHCNGWPDNHAGARMLPLGPAPAIWRREWRAQQFRETTGVWREALEEEA